MQDLKAQLAKKAIEANKALLENKVYKDLLGQKAIKVMLVSEDQRVIQVILVTSSLM